MPASYYILLFSAIFTLLHGIEKLTGQSKIQKIHYITAIVMADVALILYNHAILSTDLLYKNQKYLIFYLTSLYVIGPLNYLYYYSLISSFAPTRRFTVHFIPAILIFFLECYVYLSSYQIKKSIIESVYQTPVNVFIVLLIAGGLIFVLYQLFFLYQCLNIFKIINNRKGLILIMSFEITNVLTPIPIVMWIITKYHFFYAIGGYMTTAVIIILFLTNRRFPYLFETIAEAIRNEKYKRNHLSAVNKDELQRKLTEIMNVEKIYLDPDINLNILSGRLCVTPHQLSQYLNEYCKTRFNHYINKLRIEEAKKILQSNPEANIIEVAFYVGFNSKSAFNKTFKEYTRITPSEFKKNSYLNNTPKKSLSNTKRIV